MAKFLPDSITYTMGKRAYRYVRATGKEKRTTFSAQVAAYVIGGALVAIPAVIGFAVLAAFYVLLGVFYVIVSPVLLLGWLAEAQERRAKSRAKKMRYQRYLQKKANKNP